MRPECCGKPMSKGGGMAQSGRQRYRCTHRHGCGRSTTGSVDAIPDNPGYDQDLIDSNNERIRSSKKRRMIVTSAQNNTPLVSLFFKSLLIAAEHLDAELIIIPSHYKNTSLYSGRDEYQKSWSSDVQQYMIDDDIDIGCGYIIMGSIRIEAPAMWPLSGLQPIGGELSTLFGHPQFAMEPVPTAGTDMPKRMWTTGSVTRKNYSRSVRGAKAEFNHISGALLLELDRKNKWTHVRQLNSDSRGRFYDLDKQYTPDGVTTGHSISTLTTGDEHVSFIDPTVVKSTYTGKHSITSTLQPRYIIRHDVMDGYAGSHHHMHDDVKSYRKFVEGTNDYRRELDGVVRHLNKTTPDFATNIFPASNHDDHLDKWLNKVDPRKDHTNATLIHELKLMQYTAEVQTPALQLYLSDKLTCKCQFVSDRHPWVVGGVDYSQHGHVGVKGARGSARAFANTTSRMTIGHSHTARIVKGVYQTGKSCGPLEYERGLSDTSNTHVIQYKSGKRSIIDIQPNGDYKLPDKW